MAEKNIESRRTLRLQTILVGAFVVVAQFTATFILYRARVVSGWRAGDLVVFGMPLLVAVGLHLALVAFFENGRRRSPLLRTLSSLPIALAVAIVTAVVAVSLAVNSYGG
jgi:hypothetical protein